MEDLIQIQKEQAGKRVRNRWTADSKTFRPTNIEDLHQQEILKSCSNIVSSSVTKDVLIEYLRAKDMPSVGIDTSPNATQCTRQSGSCHVFTNNGIPCAHLIHSRLKFFSS